jgi:heptosyltransferase-1
MKALIIKMSSMGDVLHTLPAISEARQHWPGIRFDWVVEEGFAEIPAWHAAVDRVIPVALRRWRRQPLAAVRSGEWRAFRRALRLETYDCIIDAQGLIKSAVITRMAHGARWGLDRFSAREPMAALAYRHGVGVARSGHAIERTRKLFAAALGYTMEDDLPEYGIAGSFPASPGDDAYLVFLHGTTWASKLWPLDYWKALVVRAGEAGFEVRLPWGTDTERQRADVIAAGADHCTVLDSLALKDMAGQLAGAQGCVAVDSGLGHLAAALEIPAVSIYGSTDPARTGTRGRHQRHLAASFACAPCLARECGYAGKAPVRPACYETVPVDSVWEALTAARKAAAQS